MTLFPCFSAMPEADHVVVPEAMPEPPRLFVHDTSDTPSALAALPARVTGLEFVVYVGLDVGDVMVIVGAAAGALNVACAVVFAVGVTVQVAPEPYPPPLQPPNVEPGSG